MTRNEYLEEDFEREYEKSFVYLYEREKEIEEEYYNSLIVPAKIILIDKRKDKKNECKKRIIRSIERQV